jgi:hypothetical protein
MKKMFSGIIAAAAASLSKSFSTVKKLTGVERDLIENNPSHRTKVNRGKKIPARPPKPTLSMMQIRDRVGSKKFTRSQRNFFKRMRFVFDPMAVIAGQKKFAP